MSNMDNTKKTIRYIVSFFLVIPLLSLLMTYSLKDPEDLSVMALKEEVITKENRVLATEPERIELSDHKESMELKGEDFVIKRAYLTFDDGPSFNTDRILDILDYYGVKASFFVNNRTDLESIERYRRIVDEGHTLGLHSCSHVYSQVYKNADAFLNDYKANQAYVASVTGVVPVIYRFPGGSDNHVSPLDNSIYENILNDMGVRYYDWNVSAGDAVNPVASKDRILHNIFTECDMQEGDIMVLLHDLPEKTTTVEALPEIIEGLLARGYVLLPIDTGEDSTTPEFHLE
ncbi:MAG: polysaccharide deacetylase [Lachnospiraceae bacterium]|nr:polysaccharide deacetylase [Lachnospiraceae bacterium]